jgi:VRR-NUC domain
VTISLEISEKAWMATVLEAARACGWLAYHTHNSRRSAPGFPDVVAVRGGRVLFVELKAEGGRLSEAQAEWLAALGGAGADVHVWRPSDWDLVQEVLR